MLNMVDYILRWGWNKENKIFGKVMILSFNFWILLKLAGLGINFFVDLGLRGFFVVINEVYYEIRIWKRIIKL